MSYFNRSLISSPILSSVPQIATYVVTPSSISGTTSTTLTHTVTGTVGASFTLSVTGATTYVIPASGTFTTTSTQGAQGIGAPPRTLTFTATNTLDSSNVLTDTVAQGAGAPATIVLFGPTTVTSRTPAGSTYTDGDTLTSTVTATSTSTGNTNSQITISGTAAFQVASYTAQVFYNGVLQNTFTDRGNHTINANLPIGTVVTITVTFNVGNPSVNVNDKIQGYRIDGSPSGTVRQTWTYI